MRISGLDFVRGIAVILVIFRHGTYDCFLQHIGWSGVDLFFVLSGYLIATLVIREFLDTGHFLPGRFFIRRGFKIYPAFYCYLIVALITNFLVHQLTFSSSQILAEVFFMQSYFPHIWTHTWSLAVEEQFYIVIALLCLAIRYWNPRLVKKNIWAISGVLMFILGMRIIICYPHRFDDEFTFMYTHLRVDGIVVGVLVAYLVRFTHIKNWVMPYLLLWLIAAGILMIPLVFTKTGGFIMNTFGLTCLNLAFGILVLIGSQWTLKNDASKWIRIPVNMASFIGVHSYSIYLWHLLVLQELYRFGMSGLTYFVVYFICAIGMGVSASYIIEYPFLKWRDKLFPAYNAQQIKG